MKTVVAAVLILSSLGFPCSAQSTRWFDPLAQVKQFLQLTDSQLEAILRTNDEYNRWSAEKQNRIRQLQTEIAAETAKEILDPSALGARYAEIESVCREMRGQATEYQKKNTAVLTDPQIAKLKVLEDAMKLAAVISEAQSGNLIGSFNYAPPSFTSSSSGSGGWVSGPSGVFGCNGPGLIGGVILAGDSASPSAPNRTLTQPSRTVHRWLDTREFRSPAPASQPR